MRRMGMIVMIVGAIVLSLLMMQQVNAIGNGPGGTPPPSCTKDTWSCTDWSTCSLSGQQTRDCSLTTNCPTVEDEQPTESRSCTPDCTEDTWTCSEWSTCGSNSKQTRTCTLSADCSLVNDPKPVTEQSCQPACTSDTYDCSDWSACSTSGTQTRNCTVTFDCPVAQTAAPLESQACTPSTSSNPSSTSTSTCAEDTYDCTDWSQCRENGHQVRTCTLTSDCVNAATAAPETDRLCEGLRCGQLATLEERIACRLELTEEEQAAENNILYFPEYCKVEDEDEKISCIALYQSFGPCWEESSGDDRRACGQELVGLKSAAEEKANCMLLQEEGRSACALNLKEKVEDQLLFHLYELEFQAEQLLEDQKLSAQQVVDLEVYIEIQKQRIEQTATVSEWKTIVSETKIYWENLTSNL